MLPAPSSDPASVLPGALVWRAGTMARPQAQGWATGFPELDAELPGGGWPRGELVELLAERHGIGEIELLLPMLRRVEDDQWLAWVAPPFVPYAPALQAAGLPLARLLLIRPDSRDAAMWALRQALGSGACHAVLGWLERADTAGLRRLRLAAEDAGTPLFLFRPAAAANQASPAGLRLVLAGAKDSLSVRILKRRGPLLSRSLHLPLRPWLNGRGASQAHAAAASAACIESFTSSGDPDCLPLDPSVMSLAGRVEASADDARRAG